MLRLAGPLTLAVSRLRGHAGVGVRHPLSRAVVLASGAFLAACAHDELVAPHRLVTVVHLAAAVTCTMSRTGAPSTKCTSPVTATARTRASAERSLLVKMRTGGRSVGTNTKNLFIGGQDTYLRLEPTQVAYSGGTFSVAMQLRNLLQQPMGTLDGVTAAAGGTAVLFPQGTGATVIGGSGTVTLANPDSIGTGVNSGVPFINYQSPIPASATSDTRIWQFAMPTTVTEASFTTMVFTTIQDSLSTGFDQTDGFDGAGEGQGNMRCVIRTGGIVYCNSSSGNALGALGNGQLGYTADGLPRTVPGSGFLQVSAGNQHACAITATQVKCWGSHAMPMVGARAPQPYDTANYSIVTVPLPDPPVGIATTAISSCALTSTAAVWCWGMAPYLGTGSSVDKYTPQFVGSNVLALAAGYSNVCIIIAGPPNVTQCWGDGTTGLLGNGTTQSSSTPVTVSTPPGRSFVQIAVGLERACAVDDLGGIWCWGRNDHLGTTDSVSIIVSTPTPLVNPTGAVYSKVFAGINGSCAMDAQSSPGSLFCWGTNDYGQLGLGDTVPRQHPTRVSTIAYQSVSMSTGSSTCAARAGSGQLDCWGTNYLREMGVAAPVYGRALVPTVAVTGVAAQSVSTGANAVTCFVSTSGQLACMGYGANGQLGDGRSPSDPVLGLQGVVGLPTGIAEVGVMGDAACARHANGSVYCWGGGASGELAQGDSLPRPTAVPVSLPAGGARAIVAGMSHVCALRAADSVTVCWGNNGNGQTGQPVTGNTFSPTVVPGAPKFWKLAAGAEFTCGLRASDSTAFCWGFVPNSQAVTATPTAVPGSAGVNDLAAGASHLCVVPRGGVGLLCLGFNDKGQLGDGTITNSASFVTVPAFSGQAVASLALYGSSSCALMGPAANPPGEIFCWGENASQGRIGLGTSLDFTTAPTSIASSFLGWRRLFATALDGACAQQLTGELWCWGPSPGDGSKLAGTMVQIRLFIAGRGP